MARNIDWREYIDESGDFELARYLYNSITDLMKSSLDLGTLLSADAARLRAYKEQVKSIFKGRWLEMAQALEYFDIIVPCGCSNEYCKMCFSGQTRYITRDGVKTFEETVGSTQMVLTNEGLDRRTGFWVEAEIKSFGESPLMKVEVSRNGITKEILATPHHPWLVRGVMPGERNGWDNHREVRTEDLIPGHRLSYLYPQNHADDIEINPLGALHGIVYGDGHSMRSQSTGDIISTRIELWGEKNIELLRFFPENSPTKPVKTVNGVEGIQISQLPHYLKTFPQLDEPKSYLMGFLAGYFAADGTTSKDGQASISCADRYTLERIRTLASHLGIGTFGITEATRKGCYGKGVLHDVNLDRYGECSLEKDRQLYSLQFVRSDLKSDFFLTKEHRNRFVNSEYSYERLGWVVKSVEHTNRTEEVFCAVVPSTHTFALEDNIWVHNCGGARYRLNSTLSPDQMQEIALVVSSSFNDDPKIQAKLQEGLARALQEVDDM